MLKLKHTLLFTLAAGTPLAAQESQPEQLLVTATRVAEDAQALPIAWSVVSKDDIELTGAVHINELMQRVPGTWISRGNGQESLTALRSPVLTGAGSCGPFYMAWDGISLRAPGFCNVNQLFDANSEQAAAVEVIKGPATALYGSNAMHGVINILSAAAGADTDHALAVEVGPDDYYRGKYRYSGTQGRHGFSIRANGTTDGGYKDDSGYDEQKLTLRHDYAGDQWDFITALEATNLNQETAGFIQGFKAYEDSDLKDSNPNPEAYRDAWSFIGYSSASTQLNENNRLTITPYVRKNEMEFLQHFVPWQPTEENGHESLGLRAALRTEASGWQLNSGIDLEYTDGWLKEIQDEPFSPNQPAGVHYNYQVDASTAAAYSQVIISPSPRLELTAGARYEYTEYDYDNRTSDGSACAPLASNCRFFRPSDRNDTFSDWSLNAGASYAVTDQHIAYVRLASGFRAPQTAELYRLQAGQERADLDSEEMDNIEIGLRGTLMETLAYDMSAYAMEKDNVIFQDSDRQNVSGARTTHRGVELSLDYDFANAWYLGLDMTYAQHRYDSRIELLGSSGDIKGNDIDTAPKVFGSARIGWDMSANQGWPALAELEWVYLDEYYLDPDNEHIYDGHSLLNLRVRADLTPRWSGTLRLTNLLDEDYAERADFGFGQYRYFVGQPLGAYLEVSYRFAGS
jgi:outer membrane receptor protein involved in Fe transport